ncbi:hypothetical protein NHQ30_002578 [Ciborinia camelliae]|nr:hypothetical protein NHQ30_002578 [Ciborinia camelliae]
MSQATDMHIRTCKHIESRDVDEDTGNIVKKYCDNPLDASFDERVETCQDHPTWNLCRICKGECVETHTGRWELTRCGVPTITDQSLTGLCKDCDPMQHCRRCGYTPETQPWDGVCRNQTECQKVMADFDTWYCQGVGPSSEGGTYFLTGQCGKLRIAGSNFCGDETDKHKNDGMTQWYPGRELGWTFGSLKQQRLAKIQSQKYLPLLYMEDEDRRKYLCLNESQYYLNFNGMLFGSSRSNEPVV